MNVQISSALLLGIMRMVMIAAPKAHLQLRNPGDPYPWHEWCGILRGRHGTDGGEIVTRADLTDNVAVDPAREFEIDPAALIAAYRGERRARGLAVLGFFHTHPNGPAVPSLRDAECAVPDGKLWVIAGRDGSLVWRAVENGAVHGRFDRVIFDLKIGSRIEKGCPGVQWRGIELERSVRFELEARGEI